MLPTPEDTFNEVLRAHYGRVHAYAARRVGVTAADDVAAEVFTVAWRRWSDVPTEPLPWLLATARLTCMNELRGRRRADGATTRLADELIVAQQNAHAKHDIDGDLIAALRTLSERDRELILLAAWEELSHRHIAEIIGTSATNVGLRMFRARRRLERALTRTRPPSPTPLDAKELSDGS